MRKLRNLMLLLSLAIGGVAAYADSEVYTDPTIVQQSSENITVYFDASSTALSSETTIYAYTGLTVSGTQWSTTKDDWSTNSDDCLLTNVSGTLWSLTISSITDFYGISSASNVTELLFVFRSSDGSSQSSDYAITVYEDGFVATLSSDADVIQTSPTVSLTVNTTESASISLYADDSSSAFATASSVTSYTTSYTFSATGSHTIKAVATSGTSSYTTSITLNYLGTSTYSYYLRGTLNQGPTVNSDGTVTFCLLAPYKETVVLIGEWNDYEPSVDGVMYFQGSSDERYFWVTVDNLDMDTEYGYFFVVDGDIFVADPYAKLILDPWNDQYINYNGITRYEDLKDFPSEVTSTYGEFAIAVFKGNGWEYDWEVPDFDAPDESDLMIYELLLRDFTTEQSLSAAMEKLDYLDSLGVTAIELMPIMEFDGNNSWGYNPNFYFAPDKYYGSPEMYKQFIDECHKRGLAVILDIVFNHIYGQHPWCKMYWDDSSSTPTSGNPFLNSTAPHNYSVGNDWKQEVEMVQDYLCDVLQYWLEEYKVDGFRFDLTKGLGDSDSYDDYDANSYNSSRITNVTRFINAAKAVNSDAYCIFEAFVDDSEQMAYRSAGGMAWENVNSAFCQLAMGYSTNSDISALYYYSANSSYAANTTVSYAESHDEERMGYKALAYGSGNLKGQAKYYCRQLGGCGMFVALTPGPRMMWQFGEMGYDISGGNSDTDEKTPYWERLYDPYYGGLVKSYRELLNIRKNFPDLFTYADGGTFYWSVSTSNWDSGRFLTAKHSANGQELIGAMNPTGSAITTSYTFDSQTDANYQIVSRTYGSLPSFSASNSTITIPAYSYVVIANFETGTGDETDVEFYLSGALNSWSEYDSDYKFTPDGEGTYTLYLESYSDSASGQGTGFKIMTNGSDWYSFDNTANDSSNTLPFSQGYVLDYSDSNPNMTLGNSYSNILFTITVSGSTVTLTVTSDASESEANQYYLSGAFNGWDGANPTYGFSANSDGTYSLTVTDYSDSADGQDSGIKVFAYDGTSSTWYGNGETLTSGVGYKLSSSGNNMYLGGSYDEVTFTLSTDPTIRLTATYTSDSSSSSSSSSSSGSSSSESSTDGVEAFYLVGSFNTYTVSTTETEVDDGITVYINSTSSSYYIYAWDEDENDLLGSYPGTQFNGLSYTYVDGLKYYYYTFDSDLSKVNLILNNGSTGSGNQTEDISITADTYLYYSGDGTYSTTASIGTETTETVTIYVKSSSSQYYIYAWDEDETKYAGSWPGTKFANLPTTTYNGSTYYYLTTTASSVYVMFNTGTGGNQTGTLGPYSNDTYLTYEGGTSTSDTGSGFTIYINSESADYYVYAWADDTDGSKALGVWPGARFGTLETTTIGGTSYYYYTFIGYSSVSLIFNEGWGSDQTSDITGISTDTYFTYNGGTSYSTGAGGSSSDDDDDSDSSSSYTVNVYVSATYATTNYIYAYNLNSSTSSTDLSSSWPGDLISSGTSTTIDGNTYYKFSYTGTAIYIIFYDGDTYRNETSKISLSTAGDYYFCYDGGTSYTEGKRSSSSSSDDDDDDSDDSDDGITVYVSGSSSYCMYAWYDGVESVIGAWPGAQFSSLSSTTVNGTTYYYYTFTEGTPVYVIFDTGTNGNQTGTIAVTSDTYFSYSGDTTINIGQSANSGSTVTAYIYCSSASSNYLYSYDSPREQQGSWPGTAISSLGNSTTINSKKYYYYTYSQGSANIILNGGDGNNQTGNITIYEDVYITYSSNADYITIDGVGSLSTTSSAASITAAASNSRSAGLKSTTTTTTVSVYSDDYKFAREENATEDDYLLLTLAAETGYKSLSSGFSILGDNGTVYGYGGSMDYNTNYTFSLDGSESTLSTEPENDYIVLAIVNVNSSSLTVRAIDATTEEVETGITTIEGGEGKDVTIIAINSNITVLGSDDVRIYNLSGALVSDQNSVDVPAGAYIVRTGSVATKVMVRP